MSSYLMCSCVFSLQQLSTWSTPMYYSYTEVLCSKPKAKIHLCQVSFLGIKCPYKHRKSIPLLMCIK